jgi:hypothetical protein
VYAAKIANEIIDVRTGSAFANARGIESGTVVRLTDEIKATSPNGHRSQASPGRCERACAASVFDRIAENGG